LIDISGFLLNIALSPKFSSFRKNTMAEINPEEADSKNITPLNQLMKDRRPEYYAQLIKT